MSILALALPVLAQVSSLASASGATVGAASPTATAVAEDGVCPEPATATSLTAAAELSASYTASWNDINAVRDGRDLFTGGTQKQIWGTYSSSRPQEQWLQFTWAEPALISGASMSFWHDNPSDTAGDGVAVPESWVLQSWMDGSWERIELSPGTSYPRAKDAANAVTFAEPVSTTRLRAVFTPTSDGTKHAAVAVSEFGLQGDAPDDAPTAETLTSSAFTVQVNRSTGGIYHLGNTADAPLCTNYVANPTDQPQFVRDDSRWTGDVTATVDGRPAVTGLSDDIRTVTKRGEEVVVSYEGNSANPAGIRGFDLEETYELTDGGEVLSWDIGLENTSAGSIEVQDLALPMLMNSWWNGGDQQSIYEQNVGRHSYVAQDGSYAYWQRPNGRGPFLVMVPKAGTSWEFRNKARTGEGPFGERDPAWEGLVEFAVHSKALQPARAGKIGGYLPPTSLVLPAGESKSYGFTFRWAEDYADLHDVLYEAGVVDAVSFPGMVVPEDQSVTLAVRARDGIESVTGESGAAVEVTPAGRRDDYSLYTLDFAETGPSQVVVTYAGGRRSVMQYQATRPIAELIESRARFLVEKQQARTERGYDGAFLQWDMSRKKLITWDDYPGGGWKQWMAGGSDDLGLAPAAFLAEKNLIQPDQEQIAAIDYYIENFLLGYLQSRTEDGERTWQVYRWFDGQDGTPSDQGVWRAYNYTHIANTYLAMYQLKRTYPDVTTAFSAQRYLDMAYRTLDAMFTKIPQPTPIGDAAHHLGLMGEGTYPQLLAAMDEEGMSEQAATLRATLKRKYEYFANEAYPFASEASIDTTGFETSYTLAGMFGDGELADKVQAASMASRGLQPLWYYYGSDNRHMGESWWNLGYETQLGAWQQQQWLQDRGDVAARDFDDMARSTYGAYNAGWANINAGQISADPANLGAASWQYQSQKGAGEGAWSFMPMLDGWWAWSGEADLGFWGALRTATVAVVDDDIVGEFAYGGSLDRTGDITTITPHDGVGQRLWMYNRGGFGFEISGATYTSAAIAGDLGRVTLEMSNPTATGHPARVRFENLPVGRYEVSLDGERVSTVESADGVATVDLAALSRTSTLELIADGSTEDATAPSTEIAWTPAEADGDAGWYTSAPSFTLTASDEEGGSGVASTQYRIGEGEWTDYAGGPVAVEEQGETTVSFRSTDVAGNEEEAGSATVSFDSVAATTQAAQQAVTEGVRVTLTATDASSGVAGTQYRVDQGAWTAYTAPFTVTGEGRHNVRFRSTDVAGNVEEVRSLRVTVTPAPQPVEVKVTTSARSQCVNGMAHVAVYARNTGTVWADIRLTTKWGTHKVSRVAPGGAVYKLFAVEKKRVSAGQATVAAYHWDGTKGHYVTQKVAWSAITCG